MTPEPPVPARGQLQHLGAQDRFGFDRRLGAIAQDDALADGESDPHFGALQAQVRDPAHAHAGNPHRVAGFDAAGLGEVGRVVVGVLDERQLVVLEGDDGDAGQDDGSQHAQHQGPLRGG